MCGSRIQTTMNILEKFLPPIDPASPCGEDISSLPEFLELDYLIQGKSETQFSEAVKPDWRAVIEECEKMLSISKDLRVVTIFALASMQTSGLLATAEALSLISQWLQQYWTDLYPRLDPDDHFDPLERINILSSLACPVGTFGDPLRFIGHLTEVPLTNSPLLGKLSYKDITGHSAANTNKVFDRTQIKAALRDTPQESLTSNMEALKKAKDSIETINTFLNTRSNSSNSVNFLPLLQQLSAMEKELSPYVTASPSLIEISSAQDAPQAKSNSTEINSRNDVVSTLERLQKYYSENEPGSPIPLLLERTKRLVHFDFLQIMAELAPDSVSQIRLATGSKEKN